MSVFSQFQLTVLTLVQLVLLVATVVAIIDAAVRPAPAFEAAGKLTKKGWLLILVVAAGVIALLGGIGLFAGAVATIVYYVDVRPAVASLTRRN